ncbi:MAG: serine hydrolase domain-containing protein [Bdellovibrionota bacterium]
MEEAIDARLNLVAEWFEVERLRLQLPGALLGYFTTSGLEWVRGFGAADPEQGLLFDAHTRFRVASISKLFTATLVLQARDQGLLALDAPVDTYLPWFKLRQAQQTARPITVKQLLLHTGGLPRETGDTYWNDPSLFPDQLSMRAAVSQLSTVFPPDLQYKYSNLGIALAGEVLEAVTGTAFEALLSKNLLQPLGLTDTLAKPNTETPRLAKGYLRKELAMPRLRAPFTDARALTPAAGLCSTAADLAKFMAFQFSDAASHVLSRESREEMHRAHFIESDWRGARGLGFRLRRVHGLTAIGHEGWIVGYRSYLGFLPELNVGLVVFLNADDAGPFTFFSQAVKMLRPILERGGMELKSPDGQRSPEDYCGKYRSTWSDFIVFREGGSLYLSYLGETDPTESRFGLDWHGDDAFRLVGTDGGAAIGEQVSFSFGSERSAIAVRVGDVVSERVVS